MLGAIVVLTIAAGVTRYASGVHDIVAFVFATLALAGLAWVVSFATEQVGGRFGPRSPASCSRRSATCPSSSS